MVFSCSRFLLAVEAVQAEFGDQGRHLRTVGYTQSVEQLPNVVCDGAGRQNQLLRNLMITEAARDQDGHFQLPRRQVAEEPLHRLSAAMLLRPPDELARQRRAVHHEADPARHGLEKFLICVREEINARARRRKYALALACDVDGDHHLLPNGRVLLSPRETVQYAYFPVDGVVSLLMVMEDGTPVEVATVGSEGFVSVESILSTDQSPFEVICQTEVEALRADVADLRAAFRASEALRDVLLRYAAVVFSCTGRSVACKMIHSVEQRLARWLLMTRDRVRADEVPLTQDTLARMLGVHRPTISGAAESLRDRGLIAYRRGKIAISDRAGLETASCEHYAQFREVYEQLLGPGPGSRDDGGPPAHVS